MPRANFRQVKRQKEIARKQRRTSASHVAANGAIPKPRTFRPPIPRPAQTNRLPALMRRKPAQTPPLPRTPKLESCCARSAPLAAPDRFCARRIAARPVPRMAEVRIELSFTDGTAAPPSPQAFSITPQRARFFRYRCPCHGCDGRIRPVRPGQESLGHPRARTSLAGRHRRLRRPARTRLAVTHAMPRAGALSHRDPGQRRQIDIGEVR